MFDMQGSARRLDAMYVLTTAEGVEELLRMWDKVLIMPYDRGDYGVIDLIIDFSIAVSLAKISDKQRTALELVLVQGFTEEEVAGILGVSQSAINQRIKTGTEKIAKVYRHWTAKGAY